MRIISGELKGRKLQSVRGVSTRPTSDRVRESLFNILGSTTENAHVLDLFAGTGALGIEALSRGARDAVFIDRNTQALSVLRKNINTCRLAPNSLVIQWDIVKNLNCLKSHEGRYDLVFMDPPYYRSWISLTLGHLLECQCLAHQAVIVAEHETDRIVDVPSSALELKDCRRYGQTALSIFCFTTAAP